MGSMLDIRKLLDDSLDEEDMELLAEIKEKFMRQGILPVLIPGTTEVAFLKRKRTAETDKVVEQLKDTYETYSVVDKVRMHWERNDMFSPTNYDRLISTDNTTMEELIEYVRRNNNLSIKEFIEKYGEDVEIRKENGDGTFSKVYRKQTIEEILEPELSKYRTKTYERIVTYKIKRIFKELADIEEFASSIYNYLYGEFKSFQLGASYAHEYSASSYKYNPEEENFSLEKKSNLIKAFIESFDYEIVLCEDVNALDNFWFSRFYQMNDKKALLELAGHYTSILKNSELSNLFESIDFNELLNNSEHSYMLTQSKRPKGKVKSKK
jgi:hypothetical protein